MSLPLEDMLLKNDDTTFDGYLYIQWQIKLQLKYLAHKKEYDLFKYPLRVNLLDGISNTTFYYQ